jgi:FAD/FMN-containing dehydrogenase
MTGIEVRTMDDKARTIDEGGIADLRARVRGTLVLPSDAVYDETRAVWNAMIDRRPGLIVRCSGTADVLEAVRFARQHGLMVSVRGAGHNIAGKSVWDGAMMIDLSSMRAVQVDPDRRTVRTGGGATLGDIDHETQAHGLALPVGINSTTGIAGLTLGGGFGWLSRSHGLTADNLIGAEVVTAAGQRLYCNSEKERDLFWAIRGGSGNFGVVTSFEFKLHPVGPQVFSSPRSTTASPR